jgi:hypothetical protein
MTKAGLALINETMTAHVANEQRLLRSLNLEQQKELADLLRTLLLDMGHDQTDPVNLE